MLAKSQNSASPLILRVAVAVPIYRLFDYLAPEAVDRENLIPGLRLEVPFGKSKKVAYLIEVTKNSNVAFSQLKTITNIIDDAPLLCTQDIRLLRWTSDYYHHPLGEVMETAFPLTLRRGQSATLENEEKYYALTKLGEIEAIEQLKRSPKQQKLFAYFQQSKPSCLSEIGLNQLGFNWRSPIKALIDKQLIQANPPPKINSSLVANEKANLEALGCSKSFTLSTEQQSAVNAVTSSLDSFKVFLLEGVTGSGKTEVYMQIIRSVLARGQQVLVLVPEINLTPQLVERFEQRFSVAIAISHSGLTDKQRHAAWLKTQQGTSAILLGTRSVLLTPLKNPGLIILDEEHDTSFKQQEGFRFSARDVAIVRGKLLNIPVLLGSATPSLESLYNAGQQRYRHLILSERAGNAVEPTLYLLDIRNKRMHHGLSEALIGEIRKVLAKDEQVLIFLNRRGFAPTLTCHGCGWVARCKHCDANLVVHSHSKLLRCHHCCKEQRLPPSCPACNSEELTPLGLGTERIEIALEEVFPDKTLVRLDRDTTQRKGSLERYLAQINEGHADIVLGTQMLAKGHHFPNVTLVAIVDVDSGLFSIDYRAAERLAQLIVQISGRAGRAEKPGKVILQTRHPEHPLLNTLIHEGYNRFAQITLAERKQAQLPPFSYHALLRAQAKKSGFVIEFLQHVANFAQAHKNKDTQILGPVAAPMEKRVGVYRYQLLLQSRNRKNLQALLTEIVNYLDNNKTSKKIRWSVDVDPVDLF